MTRYRTAKLRRIADEDVEESALDRIIREQLDQISILKTWAAVSRSRFISSCMKRWIVRFCATP